MGNAVACVCMYVPVYFLVCDLGESVTSAFGEMDEIVYDINWPDVPPDIEKYVVLVLAATQQPIIMEGIFGMDCSRFTFKRVNL